MRFGGENFAEKNRIELRNRRRLPTETLTDMHIDIRQLSALAYPDTDHKTREVISCDYFIDALANPELGLKIRERQPKDLDAALHIALQLEVWHKDSERLQLALPVRSFTLLRGKLVASFYYLIRQQTQEINVNVKYNVQTIITYIQCKIIGNQCSFSQYLSQCSLSPITG